MTIIWWINVGNSGGINNLVRENEPEEKISKALERAKQDVKVTTSKVQSFSNRCKAAEDNEQATRARMKSNHDEMFVLEEKMQSLKNKMAVDIASLPQLVEGKKEHQEEVSNANRELGRRHEAVKVLSNHQKIIAAIVEEKDPAARPLGKDRGLKPKDFCEATGVEDVSHIPDMDRIDLEGTFRFLKVCGVEKAHANRNEGVEAMRYNLTMLLYPDLLPMEKVDSPDTKYRKIARRIKEQKDRSESFAKQQDEHSKRALEAQKEAKEMIARLTAEASMTPRTPCTNKRKSDDIAEDPDDYPETPVQKALRFVESLDADTMAALAGAMASGGRTQATLPTSPVASSRLQACSILPTI